MSRRTILGATLALALLGGCDDEEFTDGGPVDAASEEVRQIRAICEMRVDSPSGCTDACVAAAGGADCGDELGALTDSAEWPPFSDCSDACPTARTCTDSSGGTTLLVDCACASQCVGRRSAEFADLYLALAQCVDAAIAGVCY